MNAALLLSIHRVFTLGASLRLRKVNLLALAAAPITPGRALSRRFLRQLPVNARAMHPQQPGRFRDIAIRLIQGPLDQHLFRFSHIQRQTFKRFPLETGAMGGARSN
jgi:hypothetical protein